MFKFFIFFEELFYYSPVKEKQALQHPALEEIVILETQEKSHPQVQTENKCQFSLSFEVWTEPDSDLPDSQLTKDQI